MLSWSLSQLFKVKKMIDWVQYAQHWDSAAISPRSVLFYHTGFLGSAKYLQLLIRRTYWKYRNQSSVLCPVSLILMVPPVVLEFHLLPPSPPLSHLPHRCLCVPLSSLPLSICQLIAHSFSLNDQKINVDVILWVSALIIVSIMTFLLKIILKQFPVQNHRFYLVIVSLQIPCLSFLGFHGLHS